MLPAPRRVRSYLGHGPKFVDLTTGYELQELWCAVLGLNQFELPADRCAILVPLWSHGRFHIRTTVAAMFSARAAPSGSDSEAIAGADATTPGSFDLAAVFGDMLTATTATGGNFLIDILPSL
jgi:hypothetical protein